MEHKASPAQRLPPGIPTHIGKFPYFYASLVIHIVALGLFIHYCADLFPSEQYIATPEQERAIVDSLQQASHIHMQTQVDDMVKIKQLLEQSAGGDAAITDAEAEITAQVKTPEQLLAEAEKLSAAIEHLRATAKAKALAELLAISEEEALQKIEKTHAPTPAEEGEDRVASELAPLVEKLQQQAKAALLERQQELQQANNGVKLAAQEPGEIAEKNRLKEISRGGVYSEGDGQGHSDSGTANLSGQALDGVQQKISTFLYGDMPLPPGDGGDNVVFRQGSGQIPQLDTAVLHKGDGLVLGAGGEYSNRFYINRWHIIGPFDGRTQLGFSTRSYAPEQAVILSGTYPGKDNRLLRWQYVNAEEYPLVPPDFQENAVYYGYTELMLAQDSDLWVWIGADDNARIWLNDRVVYEGGNMDKGWYFDAVYFGSREHREQWNLTEAKQLMHFRKGRNKIMFRLFNASHNGFFAMVLSK